MKLLSTLSLLLIATGSSFAALPPTSPATLGEHMLEVNAQWSHMWPELVASSEIISFETEAERIAKHLDLVIEKLQVNSSGEKTDLLLSLKAYANNKVFPKNYVLPYRNPVFIDPQGTACAVGHLMIASGSAELAKRIDTELELNYIHEMHLAEIMEWAAEFGFTKDELAWIQPGYPPTQIWTAPGGGVSEQVYAAITLANDNVLLAHYISVGPLGQSIVSIWDGSTYTNLGSPVTGRVYDLIEFSGEYYAAGSFSMSGNYYDLAKYVGNDWVYSNAIPGSPVSSFDLHEHDGQLYAAGSGSGFAGITHHVATLQSGNWNLAGVPMNDTIWTIETYMNTLCIGGNFTAPVMAVPFPTMHVALLGASGLWHEAFGGLDAPVYDLEANGPKLYAAGQLGDMSTPHFGIAVRDSSALAWVELLPGHENEIYDFNGKAEVRCIDFIAGGLYAGGSFDIQPITGTTGQNVMKVSTMASGNYVTGLAVSNGEVNCLTKGLSNSMYIGGAFSILNLQAIPYFAWTSLNSVSIPEQELGSLLVWPSPATDALNVSLSPSLRGSTVLIHDLSGKLVHEARVSGLQTVLDLGQLSNGTYSIKVANSSIAELFVVSK